MVARRVFGRPRTPRCRRRPARGLAIVTWPPRCRSPPVDASTAAAPSSPHLGLVVPSPRLAQPETTRPARTPSPTPLPRLRRLRPRPRRPHPTRRCRPSSGPLCCHLAAPPRTPAHQSPPLKWLTAAAPPCTANRRRLAAQLRGRAPGALGSPRAAPGVRVPGEPTWQAATGGPNGAPIFF